MGKLRIFLYRDANEVSVPTYDVSAGGGGAHGESDYPYTLIEGDDLPEIIGRISVEVVLSLQQLYKKLLL